MSMVVRQRSPFRRSPRWISRAGYDRTDTPGCGGEFDYQVQLDEELWDHFGSQEKIIRALELLVDLAKKQGAA
jgi:hypothetical protein